MLSYLALAAGAVRSADARSLAQALCERIDEVDGRSAVTYGQGLLALAFGRGERPFAKRFIEILAALATSKQFWLFNVNARGLVFVMQSVAQAMVAARRPGVIVNVASQAGRRGEADAAVSAATKAAVLSLTRSAALALIAHHIRVNAVAPGVVDTPLWTVVDRLHAETTGAAPGETLRRAVEAIPARRMGAPR